ncbi:hypothetical protein BN1211_5020 [Cyberlindnera jadinii]|uniref:Profilin n=1 Tax=Cyberlindnera jadinii (strain ATCC 18201 / CBS 1600 / BCRC 20928 / JCM 3617 / NBRC 0987 / NRRL Y-1542) TaxID=983966 RepID=A0A0H5C7K0_CYBJN|nr:hypothetical protein BN1211_5020 [Cyberlindnera jadinii]
MVENELRRLVEESGILSPEGALLFSKDGVLGSYGVANLEDYDDLRDLKLTKEGFGLYELHSYKILILAKGNETLAVYTKSRP